MPFQYIKCLDKQFDIELFALKATNATSALDMANIPQFEIDGLDKLALGCGYSVANALELLQSRTKPSVLV